VRLFRQKGASRGIARIAALAGALAVIASVVATAAPASPSHLFPPPGRDPNLPRLDPTPRNLRPGAVARFTVALAQLGVDSGGAVVETNFDHVNESATSPVSLDACASSAPSGIGRYTWSFDGGSTFVSTTSCRTTWQRPVSHAVTSRDILLRVVPVQSSVYASATTTRTVSFRDVAIASLGDSAASGEGAPEHEGQSPAFVASNECDRSGWAASAQAALQIQRSLANTTVHLWHLACSGSRVTSADGAIWNVPPYLDAPTGGLLTPYRGEHPAAGLAPQVDRLVVLEAQTGLRVDRLLITAGVNDLHWSTVAMACSPGSHGERPELLLGPAQLDCLHRAQPLIDSSLSTLPAHFDALATALQTTFADGGQIAPAGKVFLTEYYDPFDSLLGPQGPVCGNDPFVATFTLRTYGIGAIENPIEAIVQNAASDHGWNFIGGIRSAFQGHGACWLDGRLRWINSYDDSNRIEGDASGTWHANRAGQLALAPLLVNAIAPGL
jgi:hypothetical protein